MTDQLLVRDVMRIGVPTCKPEDSVQAVAQQLIEQNASALVVLDEEGDSRGWIGERCLAAAYPRLAAGGDGGTELVLTAADIMEESVPECPADVPLVAAVQIMADRRSDHLFILHRAGGRAWPASVLSLRDVVRALAGPEHIRYQGSAAPRPTPLDLFRQRYNMPPTERKAR